VRPDLAVYFLGGLLVQSERYADGIPFLEQARNLDPDSWATYLYLGKAKLKLHENADAVRYLRRVSELHTNSIEVDRRMHDAMVAGAR